MSTNTPNPAYQIPVTPGFSQEPTYPQQPPKKNRTLLIVLAAVGGVLALCVGGTVIAGLSGALDTDTPSAATPTTRGAQTAAAAAPEPTKATYTPLAGKDIALTVKTMSKECFGSAGCLVTFNIDIAYKGGPVEPGSVWDVTYEVRGGEEPLIDTMEMTFDDTGIHGRALVEREQLIQTPKSTSKLTAVVTAVAEH